MRGGATGFRSRETGVGLATRPAAYADCIAAQPVQ